MPSLERFIDLTLTAGSIISLLPIIFLIKWLWSKEFSKLKKILIGVCGSILTYVAVLVLTGYVLHFWY